MGSSPSSFKLERRFGDGLLGLAFDKSAAGAGSVDTACAWGSAYVGGDSPASTLVSSTVL